MTDILADDQLLNYVKTLGISMEIAQAECRQVSWFTRFGRELAVAFPNLSGGCEIRNNHLADCIPPKDISYIKFSNDNLANTCYVFDDFIDYLAFLSILLINKQSYKVDYIILNSVSDLDTAIEILAQYKFIYCFFPTDNSGSNMLHQLSIKLSKSRVVDASILYMKYHSVHGFLSQKVCLNVDQNLVKGRRYR